MEFARLMLTNGNHCGIIEDRWNLSGYRYEGLMEDLQWLITKTHRIVPPSGFSRSTLTPKRPLYNPTGALIVSKFLLIFKGRP